MKKQMQWLLNMLVMRDVQQVVVDMVDKDQYVLLCGYLPLFVSSVSGVFVVLWGFFLSPTTITPSSVSHASGVVSLLLPMSLDAPCGVGWLGIFFLPIERPSVVVDTIAVVVGCVGGV